MSFEGDLVRPLGLVTLFSGYLEGEVDRLLRMLFGIAEFQLRLKNLPAGQKLASAHERLRDINSDTLQSLISTLDVAEGLLKRRNDLVHGQIYNRRLLSNRSKTRPVTAEEMTELAEQLNNCQQRINGYSHRHLRPLLADRAGHCES